MRNACIPVVYSGASGNAFDWIHTPCIPGVEVTFLAHPLATEEDLNTQEAQESHGCITLRSVTGNTAAAVCHGGECLKRLALQL
jgi:hypothetical protein